MSSTLFRRMAFGAPQSARAFSRLTVIGRIIREPEASTTAKGTELVKFTVVTSHSKKPDSPSSFWNVTSFDDGRDKEFLLNLPKGTLVCVEADARKASWKNSEGLTQTGINLTHRNLEVLYRPRVYQEPSEEGISEEAVDNQEEAVDNQEEAVDNQEEALNNHEEPLANEEPPPEGRM